MRLYQIFDRVAGEVTGTIMSYRIDAPAVRAFHDWLGNEKVGPGPHAGDFDLLVLGEQDALGVITPVIPVAVALGSAWMAERYPRLVEEAK